MAMQWTKGHEPDFKQTGVVVITAMPAIMQNILSETSSQTMSL
jgi:hypothetical protein